MMNDHKTIVMLASLEREMLSSRRVVQEAIHTLQCLQIGLAYPAIPANYIHKLNLQCITDCDYVLLLIGHEYGPLDDKGVGYLHAIYAAALAARKPFLALIKRDVVPSLGTGTYDQSRLRGFLNSLNDERCIEWSDHDELRDMTEQGLERLFEQFPSVGWQRGDIKKTVNFQADQSTSDKVLALEEELAHLRDSLGFDHDDRVFDQEGFSQKIWSVNYQCNAFRDGSLKQLKHETRLALTDVFLGVGPTLLTLTPPSKLHSVLTREITSVALEQSQAQLSGCHAVSDIRINEQSMDDLKVMLRALNLIRFDQRGSWLLTTLGERVLLKQRA